MKRIFLLAFSALVSLLAGCDMDAAEKLVAAREADGKAIGGACRHAGRAIEDCYTLNKKADRASVFAGWRDMNDYMRENKIDPVVPQMLPVTAKGDAKSGETRAVAKVIEPKPEPKLAEAKPAEIKPVDAKGVDAGEVIVNRVPARVLRHKDPPAH